MFGGAIGERPEKSCGKTRLRRAGDGCSLEMTESEGENK
jgi:hypothetical protein